MLLCLVASIHSVFETGDVGILPRLGLWRTKNGEVVKSGDELWDCGN